MPRFVAWAHGRPWLPWQCAAGQLVSEREGPAELDRYAYPVAVVLIPRQCGKTTFALDTAIGRCVDPGGYDYRAAYTAQTGQITTERITERIHELAATALASRMRATRSAGRERMTFRRGSYLKAFPPKDGALRGFALDLVVVDEAQEVDELQGIALDQTILPTFTTRPRRQLVVIGTAGTAASAFLARYLALARAGATGVAVIEYGADEDDDPTDPAVWRRVHPGLAAGLTDESALRSALSIMGTDGFAREYLNVWASNLARVIDARAWSACRRVGAVPRPAVAPVLGVDVALDRSAAAVVACWPDTDGIPVVEVVDYRPDVPWCAPRVAELVAAHRIRAVVVDAQGPVLTVADELDRAGIPVTRVDGRDAQVACASLLDRVKAASIGHRAETALDAAVAGAGRRRVADGWVWARRSVTVDVSPLYAASLALWAHDHRPAEPLRPVAAAG